jgi:hypothetical protein
MTIMLFALSLLDWDSLESVRRAHSDLEGAAVVFFALLVLFDVLAHFSGDNEEERDCSKRWVSVFSP